MSHPSLLTIWYKPLALHTEATQTTVTAPPYFHIYPPSVSSPTAVWISLKISDSVTSLLKTLQQFPISLKIKCILWKPDQYKPRAPLLLHFFNLSLLFTGFQPHREVLGTCSVCSQISHSLHLFFPLPETLLFLPNEHRTQSLPSRLSSNINP